MEGFDYIQQLISTIGFPITITLYLIIKFEGILKENTKAISELTNEVKGMKK